MNILIIGAGGGIGRQAVEMALAEGFRVRPPRLADKPGTGRYRWSVNSWLRNALSISRADVAHFMLHHIHDGSTYRGVVEIGY